MSAYDGWSSARNVCVIGAGTMGSGIAAHLANLGFEVSLLDISPDSAREGFSRAKGARPPHFYLGETADRVRLGNIRENLEWVREADWVCEAIIEKLEPKRRLFEDIEPFLRPDAMISTNTSGLQISLLCDGRSESFRRRFMGTHFFNPPRYLKLLELIPTGDTDPHAVQAMTNFLEERCARRVVVAKDTPGFIANRFGMWSMFHAIHVAERLQLDIEQVDLITGPFVGRPRSGSFRLNDLVGLDIMCDIAANLVDRCGDDPHMTNFRLPRSFAFLLDKGWIGDKVGQGYYRKEGKELMALDFVTNAYRQRREPRFDSIDTLGKLPTGERIAQALQLKDEVGDFLREHLLPTLRYANYLKAEISHNVEDFDRVMKWGFGWELGPFEAIDAIGAERAGLEGKKFYEGAKLLSFDGHYVPRKAEPQYLSLTSCPVVQESEHFRIRDLGDGVSAICLSTKMGTINPAMVVDLLTLLETGKFERFVLTSEARSFSAGYDLKFFLSRIEAEDFEGIETALANLQRLTIRLSEFSSVAAVFGHCLGAGTELMLGCSQAVAAAEAQIGLPEAKVGLIPGGAGTVLMRLRAQSGGAHRLAESAHQIALGMVSANAPDAQKKGFLRANDVIVFHPDRLHFEAKQVAKAAAPNPLPDWIRPEGPIAGIMDRRMAESQSRGEMTDHDVVIGQGVKAVFAKGVSLEDALAKERSEFLELCRKALSVTRIRHMLETGKPLKN